MSTSFLIVLGLVTSSLACKHLHLTGMRENFFQDGTNSWYIPGTMDNTVPATTIGNTATITTTNNFELFGVTGISFKITDQGAVYWGAPATLNDLTGYTGGDLADTGVMAPAWFPAADLTEAQYEYKVLLRSEQWNTADEPIGAYVCLFETIEETINDFNDLDEKVTETIIANWRFNDGSGPMFSQLILALTESGTTYAVMTYENLIGSPLRYVVNGVYASAPGDYATICGTGTDLDIGVKSNLRCGKPGLVVFSLSDTPCPASACGSLDPDWDSRDKNCNELIVPSDTCDVEGFCQYISTTEFNFKYTFKSTVLHPDFDTFALVATDGTLPFPYCVIATTNDAGTYTISQDFNIDGTGTMADCGQLYDSGTGIYTFLIRVWDSAEEVATPLPGYKAKDVYKQGSKFFEVKCRPKDLPTAASIAFTRPDGVATTEGPPVTGRTCTLEVANMYDPSSSDFKTYPVGTGVALGTPLFLHACYNPGSPFYDNASPYGIYVKNCKVGNTATFDDKYRNIIVDGCPTSATPGFKVFSQFVSGASAAGGTKFCITSGAMLAARWIATSDIYFQCTFDFCRTKSFFALSKCAKSCDGTGVDQARKRREVGSESVTVTAHIQVSDKAVHESSKSCANETLAYAGIGALLVCLIVAIAAAVFLFMKLMSRKRKM